jgi:hypothetical protein
MNYDVITNIVKNDEICYCALSLSLISNLTQYVIYLVYDLIIYQHLTYQVPTHGL